MEYGVGALRFSSLAGKGCLIKQINAQDQFNPYEVSSLTNRGQAFAKIGYLFPNQEYRSMAIQFSGVYHNHRINVWQQQYYRKSDKVDMRNFIYQDEMGKKEEQVSLEQGLALFTISYQESLQNHDTSTLAQQYSLEEIVPGAYFEYSATKWQG